MDINLPLILFTAVAATGFFWLADIFMFRKSRNALIARTEAQFDGMSDDEKQGSEAYRVAMATASKEPMVVEYSKSFFPVLALVFVLRSFVAEPFQIPSESMLPTLEVGDFILVNKFHYGIRLPVIRTKVADNNTPERGDVMVFFPPNEDRYFIKRVIGLPGDRITYRNHQLFVNDKPVSTDLVKRTAPALHEKCSELESLVYVETEQLNDKTFTTRKCRSFVDLSPTGTWNVPKGHYFMMGDNRDNSSDSRVWGYVPEERIVGKAVAIWMHWDSFWSLPSFTLAGAIH